MCATYEISADFLKLIFLVAKQSFLGTPPPFFLLPINLVLTYSDALTNSLSFDSIIWFK